ncbi:MAG: hypothetical protein AABM33_09515 [Pseudomonadota bacterium]
MPRAQRVWIRRSVLLLACAWPLSLHYAIVFAAPEWSARVSATAMALGALIWAIADGRLAAAMLAAGIAVLLGATVLYAPQILLFAPPVIINAALAVFFGASLRTGREPVISVFARLEQGGVLPPDLARHARSVTWIWTLLLAAIAILVMALGIWAPLETWSLFANVVSYALIAALFIGEYLYRRVRFRHYRHASLAALLRNVRSANLFARR